MGCEVGCEGGYPGSLTLINIIYRSQGRVPSWRPSQSGSGISGRISGDIREECRISLLRLCLPARDIRDDDRGYPTDIHKKNWDFDRSRVGRVRTRPPRPLQGAIVVRGAARFLAVTCAFSPLRRDVGLPRPPLRRVKRNEFVAGTHRCVCSFSQRACVSRERTAYPFSER